MRRNLRTACILATLLGGGALTWTAGADGPRMARERLEPERLKAAHAARARFAAQRASVPDFGMFEDLRAVIHVHAEDSDHTRGTRDEVLAAAKRTGVQVVMWTDHNGPKTNTWRGMREGVLFIAGAEEGAQGQIRFPAFDEQGRIAPRGELKFLSHIEERAGASAAGFTGMEICNRHTDAVLDPAPLRFLAAATNDPGAWSRLIESFRVYPDEFFAAGCDYRPKVMAAWDRETQLRRVTGIGANDAHQNVVVGGVTFDPYEVSFRNLSTHILAREFSEPAVREALREGHAYVSHDWMADPTGFVFGAVNNLGVFPMGDRAPLQSSTRLVGLTPVPARLKLICNGSVVRETNGTNLTVSVKKPGTYRLEAWLPVDGEDRPWIYSNPVYLEERPLLSMKLPYAPELTNVTVIKDLAYVEEPAPAQAKHKLDLFLPQGRARVPVFFFVHGGAWKYGDRWQYGPFGNRFARDGVLTVIPSYRLTPRSPYPAQIEDVAAAFAWTVRNAAAHGGDTNRIFIGGHSAGGHLTALLALNAKHLERHGLSAKVIRGVIALSGVYNLTVADAMESVFGKNLAFRREASPLFHIHRRAPPFFVSYCQWDYPTLPAQAKQFHQALREAGLDTRLFFTPAEDHISEVIAMTYDRDPTVLAVLDFITQGAGIESVGGE